MHGDKTQRPPCVRAMSREEKLPMSDDGKKMYKILCLHGFRQTGQNLKGRMGAMRKRLKGRVELVFVDGPWELPLIGKMNSNGDDREISVPWDGGVIERVVKPKRGWLVTQETMDHVAQSQSEQMDPLHPRGSVVLDSSSLDASQWMRQKEGWEESRRVIHDVLEQKGPFDCVLGFSQGAAVVGALAALDSCGMKEEGVQFPACAIIIAGYASNVPCHQKAFELCREGGGISIPSLHIMGAHDEQIPNAESEVLFRQFSSSIRHLIRHQGGHYIPGTRDIGTQILRFLDTYIGRS